MVKLFIESFYVHSLQFFPQDFSHKLGSTFYATRVASGLNDLEYHTMIDYYWSGTLRSFAPTATKAAAPIHTVQVVSMGPLGPIDNIVKTP